MNASRRALVTAALTVLVAVAGAALAAPAASANSPTEQRSAHWNHSVVKDIHDRIAQNENVCNAIFLATGAGVGKRYGNAAGTAVGAVGLACSTHTAALSDTIDEAYYKGCGIDTYITLGTSTWDTKQRLVVAC